jgi:hypothetical protein
LFKLRAAAFLRYDVAILQRTGSATTVPRR